MRKLAIAGCIGLVVFGAVLVVLDVRAAVTLFAEQWTQTMAQSLALWRWGLACVIAGVLGMVALSLANAIITAQLWLARERRKKEDG